MIPLPQMRPPCWGGVYFDFSKHEMCFLVNDFPSQIAVPHPLWRGCDSPAWNVVVVVVEFGSVPYFSVAQLLAMSLSHGTFSLCVGTWQKLPYSEIYHRRTQMRIVGIDFHFSGAICSFCFLLHKGKSGLTCTCVKGFQFAVCGKYQELPDTRKASW